MLMHGAPCLIPIMTHLMQPKEFNVAEGKQMLPTETRTTSINDRSKTSKIRSFVGSSGRIKNLGLRHWFLTLPSGPGIY